ncbi:MAG: hypothetical protein MUC47_05480 [Candidatus Kapabacteria bacterium]|jgi:hypothetical protein|nr:hypothetical protein [Candidatus Kapabacteria bacterium]
MKDAYSLLEAPTLDTDVAAAEELLSRYGPSLVPASIEALRRNVAEEWRPHVSLLVQLVDGCRKAVRLGKASPGRVFLPQTAEQSTHPDIAVWHASMFAGCNHVVEVCTGAGMDTAAIAAVATHVTTFEASPTIAALARGNMRRMGIGNVEVVTDHVPSDAFRTAVATADGLWADPSRRDEAGNRLRHHAEYDPPLGLLATWPPSTMRLGVKLGPVDRMQVDDGAWSMTIIGWHNEARESVYRRIPGEPAQHTVVLPEAGVEWSIEQGKAEIREVQVGDVLVEPHAALIASGALGGFYAQRGIAVGDGRIAYGISRDDPGPSPWYHRFRVEDVQQGIDERHVRQVLRERQWGPGTEFKKRGVDLDPMELHRRMEFTDGGRRGVVFCTRFGTSRLTIYATRITDGT